MCQRASGFFSGSLDEFGFLQVWEPFQHLHVLAVVLPLTSSPCVRRGQRLLGNASLASPHVSTQVILQESIWSKSDLTTENRALRERRTLRTEKQRQLDTKKHPPKLDHSHAKTQPISPKPLSPSPPHLFTTLLVRPPIVQPDPPLGALLICAALRFALHRLLGGRAPDGEKSSTPQHRLQQHLNTSRFNPKSRGDKQHVPNSLMFHRCSTKTYLSRHLRHPEPPRASESSISPLCP